ncbi:hypothetical protein AAEO57_09930 [Flavobacterium sp. DGU38]|uniref:HEPN domain-containing protein n=1 Tax=Flavobacterium calami TaxID=3139144 RepID=A0ABU9IPZ1_9FLAO
MTLQMPIQNKISDFFYTDAHEFLKRYEILNEHASHLGNRSKLLVDLCFALECALKSLIFLETRLEIKEAYNKVKTHKLAKLVDLLEPDSKLKYNEIITTNLEQYEVYLRYQLESEIDFRNETGILDNRYYSTIVNQQWLDSIYHQVNSLLEYIKSRNPVDLTPISIADINVEQEMEKHRTFINLRIRN